MRSAHSTRSALLVLLVACGRPTADGAASPGGGDGDTSEGTDTGESPPAYAEVDLADADAKLVGEYQIGSAMAVADLDADGVDDVVLGDRVVNRDYDSDSYLAGGVYVVSGPVNGENDLDDLGTLLAGPSRAGEVGVSVAAADVNGDGVADVAAGAPWAACGGPYGGCVFVVLGPVTGDQSLADSDGRLDGFDLGGDVGASLAAGDVNSDGTGDLLVGAPPDPSMDWSAMGRAFLVQGPITGERSLRDADATLEGGVGDYVGESIAMGDTDGDGLADMVVGAHGSAYLVRSPVAGYVELDEVADAAFVCGVEAVAVADLDGDGLSEIVVGEPGAEDAEGGQGAAHVMGGAGTGTVDVSTAETTYYGEEDDGSIGWSFAVQDLDGNGVNDLVLGSPYGKHVSGSAEPLVSVGAAYVVLGPRSGSVRMADADVKLLGESEDDYAGTTVALGDIDGDGSADLLVGAPGDDSNGTWSGAAYLIYGAGL